MFASTFVHAILSSKLSVFICIFWHRSSSTTSLLMLILLIRFFYQMVHLCFIFQINFVIIRDYWPKYFLSLGVDIKWCWKTIIRSTFVFTWFVVFFTILDLFGILFFDSWELLELVASLSNFIWNCFPTYFVFLGFSFVPDVRDVSYQTPQQTHTDQRQNPKWKENQKRSQLLMCPC